MSAKQRVPTSLGGWERETSLHPELEMDTSGDVHVTQELLREPATLPWMYRAQ